MPPRTPFLLLALLACRSPDDPAGAAGGTADGGTADGGTADGGTADGGDTGGEVIHVEERAGCDPLVPSRCLLPWPSDALLAADPDTATGWRLAYEPDVIPRSTLADPDAAFDTSPYARLDGVSPATQLLALFPAPPDLSDVAFHDATDDRPGIDRSLAADSPSLLLDLETGELLPHWVEADVQADDTADPREVLVFLRQVGRLEEGHAYAVGYRGLVDEDGAPIEPSDAFRALRDGLPTDSDALEARRAGYEAMFDAFEAAGVPRDELQLAWWFVTASGEAIRGDLLAMRADALARLGDAGIGCTVTSVEEPYESGGVSSYRVVRGTYTVPSYMDDPDPPARLVRDADGVPAWTEDVEVGFTAVVPWSVVESGEPAPLVTFGHGLMGTGDAAVTDDGLREGIEETPAVLVATDWAGMSTPDAATVAGAFLDANGFPYVMERLWQGMINQVALTRTFAGACAGIDALSFDDGRSMVDPDRTWYAGGSQGGIYGATLLALSPDIDRGVLFVNGAVWPFMIERSIDFVPYAPYFEGAYPDRIDRVLLMSMAQHLWDATDPASYLPTITTGIPELVAAGEDAAKEVLSLQVLNDAQVPNLAGDQAMRMAGVPVVRGSAREPWGFAVLDAPVAGSGVITFDLGDRDVPEGNEPPEVDDGGHVRIGQEASVRAIYRTWLETGEIPMPCEGTCDPD